MLHERKKRISKYLEEMLSESDLNRQPKNKLIAKTLIDFALDESKPEKIRLEAIDMILDRLEGKAVNTNINADITDNPFEGFATEMIEKLQSKLLEIKNNVSK